MVVSFKDERGGFRDAICFPLLFGCGVSFCFCV